VQPVNLDEAVARGLITTELMRELLKRARQRLNAVGYRDLQLRAGHVLLSVYHDKSLVLDSEGAPSIRLCNFELMQKLARATVGLNGRRLRSTQNNQRRKVQGRNS
jgi:hypothetical protein